MVTLINIVIGIVVNFVSDGIKALLKKLRPSHGLTNAGGTALRVTVTYAEKRFSFLLKEFDLARKVSSYVPYVVRGSGLEARHVTDAAVPMAPSLSLQVVNTLPREEVQLAPYVVIHIVKQEPIGGEANCLIDTATWRMGGAGYYHDFGATLAPQQERIFGGLHTRYPDPPFFTVAPGEHLHFRLALTMLDGYYYTFRVGFVYTCFGEQHEVWADQSFVTGGPQEVVFWTVDTEHDAFRYVSRGNQALPETMRQGVMQRIEENNRQVLDIVDFRLPRPVAE